MIGQTISHYKITAKLGEGGMGVVYRAEDTKLKRPVALKFIAANLIKDAEARKRFEREATSAAGVSHANVCHVYEIADADGHTFLAMEFIEGESLDRKIDRGPLPLKDALDLARQAAEGLAAAHEHGVVHRDIKPANILVTPKGQLKILDFGLALLTEGSKLTQIDTKVGTVAYMSPEQAQGMEVDQRTDIWALGCVLYEMVCGQRPFPGAYDQALLYEIINQEHEPLTGVRAGVPMELEFIAAKCLAKDPSDRYQHASEIAVDLRTLSEKLKSGRSTVVRGSSLRTNLPTAPMAVALPAESVFVPKRKLRFLQGLAALLGVGLLALAAVHFTQTVPDTGEKLLRRFSFSAQGLVGGEISPDGRYVAYATETEGRSRLWLRSLADETSRELPGTDGATLPFWSPDSLSIGFGVLFPNPELKRISIDGGAPTVLCELPAGQGNPFLGGTWSPDGERIAFSSRLALHEISARGGRPRLLLDANGTIRQSWPHFVPTDSGSPAIVYTAAHSPGDIRLMTFNLASSEVRELGPGKQAVYSPAGYLIHGPGRLAGEGLWALPFSAEKLEAAGEDFPISTTGSSVSLSREGTLVYSDAGGLDMDEKTLVWRNRAGEVLETVGQPQKGLREFALSPDRRRVAATVEEPPMVWIQDLARAAAMRLTFDGLAYIPSWSPSGNDIVYTSAVGTAGSPSRLMRKAADGTGEPTVLVERGYGSSLADLSRDGRYLVFSGPSGEGTLSDILYLEFLGGDSKVEPKTFLSTPAAESVPKLSPDGRFVAYVSNESGQPEIYVRPFPSGAGRWQASVNGGKQPRWRDDGKELFYVEEDIRLMAVPVEAGEGLTLGRPQRLFESTDLIFRGYAWPQYDVSADGQRFLTSTLVDRDVPPAMRIVLNWREQFRERERN